MKCGYGGHAGMRQHDAFVLMTSPPDSRGRQRRVWCCLDAARFAQSRDWHPVVP